ncbi:MAG: hypothetical protein Fur0021_30160 [Candidatus Promineifilaceae bacterium]
MLRQPLARAAATTALGAAQSLNLSIWRALEMSQFWQKRQPKLQPAVPNERTLLPG